MRGNCILFLVRLSLGFILGFLVAVSTLCGTACGVFSFWVGLSLMLGFFVCLVSVCVLWVLVGPMCSCLLKEGEECGAGGRCGGP